jgi:hypothetical protein
MALADLPDEIHSEIDDATVVWGIGHQPCLIEGRFLDAVFAERNTPIVLIKRGGSAINPASLRGASWMQSSPNGIRPSC